MSVGCWKECRNVVDFRKKDFTTGFTRMNSKAVFSVRNIRHIEKMHASDIKRGPI